MDEEPNLSLRQGNYSLIVTRDSELIREAQELRYRAFFEEVAQKESEHTLDSKHAIDEDEYDAVCDHIIVYDHSDSNVSKVVGTYRFLRQEFMPQVGRFYSETEFNMAPLLANYDGKIVEVGRSCIDSNYRSGAVIKLLWSGIAQYLEAYDIDLLFGCASFPGTDATEHALSLSYLHHYHRIDDRLSPQPLLEMAASFDLVAKDQINERRTFVSLPPLVKGYIRLGCKVGKGAIIDHKVGTIDVCIILDKHTIGQRYVDFLKT